MPPTAPNSAAKDRAPSIVSMVVAAAGRPPARPRPVGDGLTGCPQIGNGCSWRECAGATRATLTPPSALRGATCRSPAGGGAPDEPPREVNRSPVIRPTVTARRRLDSASTGRLREGAKSYAKPVPPKRRGPSTPVQEVRTFWPCSRNWPCGPTRTCRASPA